MRLPVVGDRETLRRAMPKWDYRTIVLTGGFMGRHRDELRRDALELQFDELGGEGGSSWILINESLHGEKDGHVVIFKRPLRDEPAAQPNSPSSQSEQ